MRNVGGRVVEQNGVGEVVANSAAAALYHGNLGNVLLKQQRLDEAAACYRQAIDLRPDFSEVHSNLGYVLRKQGRLNEAVACLRKAVHLNPHNPRAHYNLGEAVEKQGRLEEAATCYRKVIDLQPDVPEAHNNLGYALGEQDQLDEAIACLRRAIAIRSNYAQAYSNLGFIFGKQQRLQKAVACYRSAVALDPDVPETHNNLGTMLDQQALLDEAIACYRRAITLKPDFAEAHNNLAMALLARGDLAEGWREYEWRWKMSEASKYCRNFAQPQWQGEPAAGRTLLIHAEQGYGDTLQFCRYASLAAAQGLRVVMEAPAPLVRLLRALPGVAQVIRSGDALADFDFHCPMVSLPLAISSITAAVPNVPAYLHADTAQAALWGARLAAMANNGPRIGLVWAGNPRPHSPGWAAIDRRRSLAPERLAPLFDVRGLHFLSLQKDGPPAPERFPLTDFMHEMADFADTAALIANLDLVISVDTAVAHLAASLGKPVWVLSRFDACWRWLVGRRDSPWYPTLRLYRQPRPGDWDSVLEEVAHDLSSLAKVRQS